MKRPGFFSGVAAAFLLAVCAAAVFALLSGVAAAPTALRLVASATGFAYLTWLFRGPGPRTGYVTGAAAWLAVSVTAWFFGAGLSLFVLLHALLIWLLRSLRHYAGALPALADLALSGTAVAAAGWAATQSGSVFLAVWCFFLVQALTAGVPARVPLRVRADGGAADIARRFDTRFEEARRRADAAFRQLIARPNR